MRLSQPCIVKGSNVYRNNVLATRENFVDRCHVVAIETILELVRVDKGKMLSSEAMSTGACFVDRSHVVATLSFSTSARCCRLSNVVSTKPFMEAIRAAGAAWKAFLGGLGAWGACLGGLGACLDGLGTV